MEDIMEIVVAEGLPKHMEGGVGGAYRGGAVERQHLITDSAEDGLNFRLFLSRYMSGADTFQSPRHHHGFQQIRWSESGTVNYAPDGNIPEGDLAYFPRGAYYGPQTKDAGVSLLLQFGFGAELSVRSVESYRQGGHIAELRANIEKVQARGRIEDGVFIDVDPETGKERRRDAGEVLAREEGRKLEIPPARYENAILIHPQAFAFHQLASGLLQRRFGSFYDQTGPNGDLRVSQVRFEDSSSFELTEERAQILWSTTDGLSIAGERKPRLTFIYSPRGEGGSIEGEDGTELFVIEFPRLD
jgi:hypothetical protein